jgi:predicted TIM-barrel fold metal-dependent hydrolase
MQRRSFLALAAQLGDSPLVDTHIHLFAADTKRFPFHPQGTYQPKPETLEDYVKFVKVAGIAHAIVVHPEPYQDDHRYLEYCFSNEPTKDFFKGTCLFDANRTDTPSRIDELTKRWPGRIRALRVHRVSTEAPTTSGAIRERSLESAEMRRTWKAVSDRGLMIQMHFIPMHAASIGELAAEFRSTRVILDHLGRNNQGTDAEWKDILALAKSPNTVMKFSGLDYSPKKLEERVRQVFDSFGPDRIIWGGLGMNATAFTAARKRLDTLFAFATEADRKKIRGLNAMKLYGWS